MPKNEQAAQLAADKRWKFFNEDVQKFLKAKDFFAPGSTYYEMAAFLKKEGKDDSKLRELGYQAKLRVQTEQLADYKQSGVITGVEIIACPPSSCEACTRLDGKVILIDEAILTNPLPVKNCTNESGCRCCYGGTVAAPEQKIGTPTKDSVVVRDKSARS